MNHQVHYIGGEWVEGQGELMTKFAPIDQKILWQANSADPSQVRAACQSAREAFYSWSHLSVSERIKIVQKFAVLLNDEKESLARVISQETSKPLWEARTEIQSRLRCAVPMLR